MGRICWDGIFVERDRKDLACKILTRFSCVRKNNCFMLFRFVGYRRKPLDIRRSSHENGNSRFMDWIIYFIYLRVCVYVYILLLSRERNTFVLVVVLIKLGEFSRIKQRDRGKRRKRGFSKKAHQWDCATWKVVIGRFFFGGGGWN